MGFVEGRNQNDGARDFGEGAGAVIGLEGFEGDAGGDAAEGLRDFDGDTMNGVEDENPIVLGELEELAIAGGEAAEWSGRGIDQSTEGAGEE